MLSRFRYFSERWQNWTGTFYYAQPHDEMCDELDEMVPLIGEDVGQKKKIYLAPRYTYKTSLLLAFMAYLFLKYREQGKDIAMDYVRAAADLAEEVLYEMQMNLSLNPFILEYWGDLSKAAYLWSAKKINFGHKRDATLSVSGLDRGASGKHPDIVIFDDIVNEKNFDSVIAKKRARNKINAYGPIIAPQWGVMLHAGTRFAYNDVTGWLLDQNEANRRKRQDLLADGRIEEAAMFEPKWKEYIRAYDDGPNGKGSLFFPAVLTNEFIEYQRQELDPRLWAAWYKNECYAEGMQLFRPEYIQYFTGHYSPRSGDDRLVSTLEIVERADDRREFAVESFPVRVTMVVDPTTTAKGRSDRTGITVVATDWRGYWWIFLAKALLEVPSVVGDKCVEYIRRFVPSICMIESAQADVEMVARIKSGIDALGVPTVIKSYSAQRDETAGERGVPGRRQKIARIESLEARFRRREIRLARNQCDDLLEQYRHWPDVDKDDVFDSLSMQHLIASKCKWSSLADAEAEYEDEEDEERGEMFRTITTTLRTVSGDLIKISYDPRESEHEPRLLGRAGVASQRVGHRR